MSITTTLWATNVLTGTLPAAGDVLLTTTGAGVLDFSSTGVAFNLMGDIVLADAGSISLNHSGAINIYGTLDAGTYAISAATAAADVIFRGTSTLVFHVDIAGPPAAPLLTISSVVGANWQFLTGSTVEVVATGSPSVPGTYTLGEITGGGTVVGDTLFTKLESGPSAGSIDDFFISANRLELTVI